MKDIVIEIPAIMLVVCMIGTAVFLTATTEGRAIVNNWQYALQKVNDLTSYDTRRQVEDACRAMIASYTSDKLTYEQYRDSESEKRRGWAEQARIRANKTAASYNEYVLRNSFMWEDNIPADIAQPLPYIQ